MGLDIVFGMLVCFITVFSFFYKLVISPLLETLNELKNVIAEIKAEIKVEREKRSELDKRITVLEEKIARVENK